jgi:hypothetical protein
MCLASLREPSWRSYEVSRRVLQVVAARILEPENSEIQPFLAKSRQQPDIPHRTAAHVPRVHVHRSRSHSTLRERLDLQMEHASTSATPQVARTVGCKTLSGWSPAGPGRRADAGVPIASIAHRR